MNDNNSSSTFDVLRHRAEEILSEGGRLTELSGVDMLSLIHELEVHQIELEMQNDELRRTRRELEESRKEYADLYELAPVGYVTINKKRIITRANLMASDMLQTPKNDLIGLGFSNFIHSEDHNAYFALVRKIVDGKGTERRGEFRLLRTGTVQFHAQVKVMPSRDGDGKFAGWRIAFLDVSDRKMYAMELERSNRELEDFAFVASHDLEEPLRKIQSFSNMAMKRIGQDIDETSKDYLCRVQSATARMQELLRALLKYSRISTQSKSFGECNLRKAVEEVAGELDLTIFRTKGTVEVFDLPTVLADTAQIRQLFQNLISNALKFHKDDAPPVVKVYTLPGDKDKCLIAVEDNGIGFEQESAEKIFAPFHRLHGRSSPYHGTGMGLAICRRIVERHGGSIVARSEPGKGSTFIISLPCK